MIRLATPADSGAILEFVMSYPAPAGFPAPQRAPAAAGIDYSLTRAMILLDVDVGGAIRGAMALDRYQWPWSGTSYLGDISTYVRPNAPGAAAALIQAARAIARHVGLPLHLGITTGGAWTAAARFYRMQGGEQIGAFFRF